LLGRRRVANNGRYLVLPLYVSHAIKEAVELLLCERRAESRDPARDLTPRCGDGFRSSFVVHQVVAGRFEISHSAARILPTRFDVIVKILFLDAETCSPKDSPGFYLSLGGGELSRSMIASRFRHRCI